MTVKKQYTDDQLEKYAKEASNKALLATLHTNDKRMIAFAKAELGERVIMKWREEQMEKGMPPKPVGTPSPDGKQVKIAMPDKWGPVKKFAKKFGMDFDDESKTSNNKNDGKVDIENVQSSERDGKNRGGEKVQELIRLFGRDRKVGGSVKQVERRQLEILEEYAERTEMFNIKDVWDEYASDNNKDIRKLPSGKEADVYALKDNGEKKIIKITDCEALSNEFFINKTPFEFIVNKIVLHNTVFPSVSYKLVGFQRKYGEIYFVLEQPSIDPLLDKDGKTIAATEKEISDDMEKKNFVKSGKYYFTKDYVVTDLEPRNVMKGSDGNLYYIDPVIYLNTEDGEYGGIRSYDEMYNI